ncbi:MAG: Rpn family recombination-promoting nuclease/putative transposase [Tannerella sp.]|jgi:predicted transposase/invertase (TIGR01784 family)|nr:Rpn family recombination-promoting nuclease/putative transposase [Tannerella sp.]
MAHYLDPKNDLTFKRIFGEHEELCMSLLNSMLPLEEKQQIVGLQYRSSELIPEIPLLKDSIVDVCCTDNYGRQFIVEMQMLWTTSFKHRVLLNASKAYVRQLDSGTDYRLVQPVYALSFVNDTFDPDPSVYYHDYKIVNIENVEKQIEGLELVFIELPKFRPTNRAEKKLYDLWLTFLTDIKAGSEQVPPELLEEKATSDAVKYLERHSYTKAELNTYDKYLDIILTTRTYYADALAKGMAKGMAEGRAEGIAEGREKNLIEAVINGMRRGFSLEQIQAFTGLSRERIKEILDSNDELKQ